MGLTTSNPSVYDYDAKVHLSMEADTRIRAAPSDGMALNTLFGASCPPLLPLRVVSSYVSLSQAAMRPTPTRMALRPRCAPPPVVAPYQRPRRTEEECCVVGGGIGGGGLGGGGLEAGQAGGRVLGNSIRCQAPSQHFTAGPHLRFTIPHLCRRRTANFIFAGK